MPVDAARAHRLALALAGVGAAPHVERIALRTPRKIFATLAARGEDLNLMFDPDLRDFHCEQAPAAFSPVPGGWGRQGAPRCDLARVDEATVMSALRAAHQRAALKVKTPRVKTPPIKASKGAPSQASSPPSAVPERSAPESPASKSSRSKPRAPRA